MVDFKTNLHFAFDASAPGLFRVGRYNRMQRHTVSGIIQSIFDHRYVISAQRQAGNQERQ